MLTLIDLGLVPTLLGWSDPNSVGIPRAITDWNFTIVIIPHTEV